jgi:hypothetical protein
MVSVWLDLKEEEREISGLSWKFLVNSLHHQFDLKSEVNFVHFIAGLKLACFGENGGKCAGFSRKASKFLLVTAP